MSSIVAMLSGGDALWLGSQSANRQAVTVADVTQ